MEKITSYFTILKSKVIQQYKGKENYNKILEIISKQFDELETVFYDLYLGRFLNNSTGQQLDNIGYNISVERQGLNDDDYRQIIYAAIGRYNSNGTIEDILQLSKLMTNADNIYLNEFFPASLNLTIIGNNLNINENYLQSSIEEAVAGGVRISGIASGKTPIFSYAPEDGSALPVNFSCYSAEDGSYDSYYPETI